jgi:2-hydroxy-6-oxonona-2,4-dienedioate hydrolase/4,5:9,10-diseco-3-hydroxy-5,9,17-trioxoandrosta-1(10),2-diene-4-oate hydrolase
VVFVHGASNSGTSWAGLAALLPDFRCVMIDRPGCGLSEPHGRRFEDVADLTRFGEQLVLDVLDALQLDRAFLVGTSFGGNVVLWATAAHGERVAGLVCLGWPVGAPVESTPLAMRIASIPGLGVALSRLPATRGAVRAILKQVGLRDAFDNGKISEAFVDAYRSLLNDTDTMTNELRQGPPIVTPIKGFNESVLVPDETLASIRVPTCFLWGTNDPMGGELIARRFAAKLPNATLEMIPGGHAVWVDDPQRVAASIRRFCHQASPDVAPQSV